MDKMVIEEVDVLELNNFLVIFWEGLRSDYLNKI